MKGLIRILLLTAVLPGSLMAQWKSMEVLHLKPDHSYSEYLSDIYVHGESVFVFNSNSWDLHPHYIFKTIDLGEKWEFITTPHNSIFESGKDGTLYDLGQPFWFYPVSSFNISTDSGSTWQESSSVFGFTDTLGQLFDYPIFAKSFKVIGETVITVSDSSKFNSWVSDSLKLPGIFKSVDQGRTWSEFDSLVNEQLIGIDIISTYKDHFLMMSDKKIIYQTHKDSSRWFSESIDVAKDLDFDEIRITESGRVYFIGSTQVAYSDIFYDSDKLAFTMPQLLTKFELGMSDSAHIEASATTGEKLLLSIADSVFGSKLISIDTDFEFKNLSEGISNYDYENRFIKLKASESTILGLRNGSYTPLRYDEGTETYLPETDSIYVFRFSSAVSNEKPDNKKNTFVLNQNYPNPFNPSTSISFELPSSSLVQLKVYNLLGQEVAALVDGRMNSGTHQLRFDASNLSSGVYVYRLTTGSQSITKKMLLIK